MTDETVFTAALEKKDPAERQAYLDQACAGDRALRRQVEELLQSHEQAGGFLNVPAVEQAAAADAPGHDLTDGGADAPQGDETAAPPPVCNPPDETQAEPADADREKDALAFLAPSQTPGSLGRLDHYEVLSVVGRGGMGVVLKARDTSLERIVAIKMLAPQLAVSGTARKRFVREAKAAAAVRDEHVVGIHAVQEAGPVPYLVMEYIDGVTLEERIRQGGPVELKEVLRIGMQIAAGLAAAHKQGLIHRDVKPANILLENGVQRVKITDFGLARAVDDASLTQSGMIAGTPMYMSPEQAGGLDIDQRSDLFSFGSVLYAMCTGRPPFRATTAVAVLKRVCEDVPHPVREINPEIPEWLATVISRLHAKQPGERFQSAAEVAELLTHRLSELRTGGEMASPQKAEQPRESVEHSPAVPPTRSRKRARMVAAAALLLISTLLAIGAGVAVWLVWFPPWATPLERRLLGTWEGDGKVSGEWSFEITPDPAHGIPGGKSSGWSEGAVTVFADFKADGTYTWGEYYEEEGLKISPSIPKEGAPPLHWEVVRAQGNKLTVRMSGKEVVFHFQGDDAFAQDRSGPTSRGTITFHRSGAP